jgi:hypothetical protein
MSSLFDTHIGVLDKVSDVSRSLELRHIPILRQMRIYSPQPTWQSNFTPTIDSNYNHYHYQKGLGDLVQDALLDLDTDWMFTAILQGALGGPAPAWSKDEWSFVPLYSDMKTASLSGSESSGSNRPTNLTLETPAIRARLECSALDWPGNISNWLDWVDSNHTWNSIVHVAGLNYSYWPSRVVNMGEESTRMTAQRNIPQCCGNITNNPEQIEQFAPSVHAYWTENWGSHKTDWGTFPAWGGTNGNFTVKWIRGPASFAHISGNSGINQLYHPEPPAIQALNCLPYFETSTARVTTELLSGAVQDYHILETPTQDWVAWSDAYKWRDISEGTSYSYINQWGNKTGISYLYNVNTTTRQETIYRKSILFPLRFLTHNHSYGNFFMKAITNAACLGLSTISEPDPESYSTPTFDSIKDRVYNMRDNDTGLNIDFMSYAAYADTGHDPTALLDAKTLAEKSQKVFSTFFQHFVSNNLSSEDGNWVLQPFGQQLKINPPMEFLPLQYTPGGSVAPNFEDIVRNTSRTVTVTISSHVEMLRMNTVAFWIATSILIWLLITIAIFASVQRRYYGGMMRNVECIADILVLIAGSERLLTAIRENGIDTIMKEDRLLTRLGWFRDTDGTMRWRIDVVDDEQVQMQPIRLGTEYAAIPDGNENEEDDGHETANNESPMASVETTTTSQSVLHGTADSPVTERRADESFSIVPSPTNSPSAILAPSAGYAPSTEVSPIESSANSMSTDELMGLGAEQD